MLIYLNAGILLKFQIRSFTFEFNLLYRYREDECRSDNVNVQKLKNYFTAILFTLGDCFFTINKYKKNCLIFFNKCHLQFHKINFYFNFFFVYLIIKLCFQFMLDITGKVLVRSEINFNGTT